jgi:pSer/pThr/pTyr-binding forkhead associated (FHA) protein
MSAKVILKVKEGGEMTGKEFAFNKATTCSVGRADNCKVRMPDSWAFRNISRHHCMLVIDPPDVEVVDDGSKNGTYVNGEKIGQRNWQPAEEHTCLLRPGDEIRIGDVVFQVTVQT